MRRKNCRRYRCHKSPYLGGLCEQHYIEEEIKTRRNDLAIQALHTSKVGNEIFKNVEIRKELFEFQAWWNRCCNYLNYNIKDEVLQDEAEYAASWCKALAAELVEAELRYRKGEEVTSSSLRNTRIWVWERFSNLENGMKSNGGERK